MNLSWENLIYTYMNMEAADHLAQLNSLINANSVSFLSEPCYDMLLLVHMGKQWRRSAEW